MVCTLYNKLFMTALLFLTVFINFWAHFVAGSFETPVFSDSCHFARQGLFQNK